MTTRNEMLDEKNIPMPESRPFTDEKAILKALDAFPKNHLDVLMYGPDEPTKRYLQRSAKKNDKSEVLKWHEEYDGEKVTTDAALHINLLNNKLISAQADIKKLRKTLNVVQKALYFIKRDPEDYDDAATFCDAMIDLDNADNAITQAYVDTACWEEEE